MTFAIFGFNLLYLQWKKSNHESTHIGHLRGNNFIVLRKLNYTLKEPKEDSRGIKPIGNELIRINSPHTIV